MVFYVNLAPIFLSPNLSLAFLLNDCVCVCVCVCVFPWETIMRAQYLLLEVSFLKS